MLPQHKLHCRLQTVTLTLILTLTLTHYHSGGQHPPGRGLPLLQAQHLPRGLPQTLSLTGLRRSGRHLPGRRPMRQRCALPGRAPPAAGPGRYRVRAAPLLRRRAAALPPPWPGGAR